MLHVDSSGVQAGDYHRSCHQAPISYKKTSLLVRSIDDSVLLILKHNLTIMLFLSLFLSLDFFGLRCLYRGNISSINIRNRWRLELRLTHRLLRRAVSFAFCRGIPYSLFWMPCIKFVHFSLDECFCVDDLLLDAIFVSGQQFPWFVILEKLAFNYPEGSETTYQLRFCFCREELCHCKHIGMPYLHL